MITLIARGADVGAVDMDGVDVSRFVDLDEGDIARLDVRTGNAAIPLGEIFDVRGGRSALVRVEGPLGDVHGLGAGMTTGSLVIAGNAGDRVAAGMIGGSVHVLGSVGHDAGQSMRGGELLVEGRAGHRLGAASPGARRGMSGGEILVSGSVGDEVGARARRGLIVVGGHAGADLGRDIIAGTLVVFGRIGERPGTGNKRGSIVALGGIDVPPTYRFACEYEPPFVRVLMTHLARRFGAPVKESMVSGRYRRHCGDAGLPGKGEILEWVRA